MPDDKPYFCVCDEEMCFCTNKVATVEEACPDCAAGKHVWEMPS